MLVCNFVQKARCHRENLIQENVETGVSRMINVVCLSQLGPKVCELLSALDDWVQFGSHHNSTLDLDLARYKQLLSIGITIG